MAILALLMCVASGYLLLSAAWPGEKTRISGLVLKLSLSLGFGIGIFSAVLFLVRLLATTHLIAIDASVLALFLILYFLRRRPTVEVPGRNYKDKDIDVPSWMHALLATSLAVAVLAALYRALIRVIAHPDGDGWDAFSIWNLHARFLFPGGDRWRDGFNPLISWSHPDYPLLLPGAIAHFWSYLGQDHPVVPAIIGLAFAFSTLALLVSSLVHLRGPISAMLGGLALSSTPFFIEQGTSQYADVPVSFFILATLVLLHLGGRRSLDAPRDPSGLLILAGLAAGFAAWTKNEGLLFLFALVVAEIWAFTRKPIRDGSGGRPGGGWRCLISFALGTAPMLAILGWFKYSVATEGDLFSNPAVVIHKVLTPNRYWIIVQWYAKEFLRFGGWWMVPGTVAMLVFYLLTPSKRPGWKPLFYASVFALGLTLAGYFAIYLITPRDLYWHLRFSLNRLFLQLWPSVIFLFFSAASTQLSQIDPHEAPRRTEL